MLPIFCPRSAATTEALTGRMHEAGVTQAAEPRSTTDRGTCSKLGDGQSSCFAGVTPRWRRLITSAERLAQALLSTTILRPTEFPGALLGTDWRYTVDIDYVDVVVLSYTCTHTSTGYMA